MREDSEEGNPQNLSLDLEHLVQMLRNTFEMPWKILRWSLQSPVSWGLDVSEEIHLPGPKLFCICPQGIIGWTLVMRTWMTIFKKKVPPQNFPHKKHLRCTESLSVKFLLLFQAKISRNSEKEKGNRLEAEELNLKPSTMMWGAHQSWNLAAKPNISPQLKQLYTWGVPVWWQG